MQVEVEVIMVMAGLVEEKQVLKRVVEIEIAMQAQLRLEVTRRPLQNQTQE